MSLTPSQAVGVSSIQGTGNDTANPILMKAIDPTTGLPYAIGGGVAGNTITMSRGGIAVPTVVTNAGGNRRTIGSVFIKRRCYTQLVGAMGATSFIAATYVFTPWFNVEEFNELLVFGTLTGSGVSAAPVSGNWTFQINDSYNGNTGTPPYGWIDHPSFSTNPSFTPTQSASFFVPQFVGAVPTPFGDMARVGVKVSGPWTGGGQLNIYIKTKV